VKTSPAIATKRVRQMRKSLPECPSDPDHFCLVMAVDLPLVQVLTPRRRDGIGTSPSNNSGRLTENSGVCFPDEPTPKPTGMPDAEPPGSASSLTTPTSKPSHSRAPVFKDEILRSSASVIRGDATEGKPIRHARPRSSRTLRRVDVHIVDAILLRLDKIDGSPVFPRLRHVQQRRGSRRCCSPCLRAEQQTRSCH